MRNYKTKIIIILLFVLVFSTLKSQIADLPINANATFNGEQSLAINPNNPAHIIVAWMKYSLFPLPATMVIATSTSTDGGLTWSNPVNIAHFRAHWQSADPTLAFKNDGTIYLGYIDYKASRDSGAVYCTKSTNGGLSWGISNKVVDYVDSPDLIIDRPWLSVDNSGGAFNGNLYMVTKSLKEDPLPHHIYLMHSTNGGLNWSAPILIDNSIPIGPSLASMGVPAVTKSGKLVIGYLSYNPIQYLYPRFIAAISVDGGASLTNSVMLGGPYTTTITNDTLLQYSYNLSANPTNSSNLVFSFTDKSNSDYDVYSINTNNEALTWSSSARISSDALNNGNNQDMVWANFSSTGKYATVWRDRRASGGLQNQPYKIWGSYSTDGGNTFSSNFQLSQTNGPLMIPIDANDFLGCVLNDSIVYSCWTDKRNTTTNQLFINKYKMPLVTGVKDLSNSTVKDKIFPNPNNGSFTLEFNNSNEKKIEVVDLSGKIIYTNKTILQLLNIKLNEAKGSYIIKITEGAELRTLNLIIE